MILPLCAGCLAAASAAQAAEAASPLAWLGFGKASSQAAKTTEVKSATAPPAVFAKMTHGTKRFVSNTKNLFVPKKPPAKRRGLTATYHAHRPEPPKQSFFKRLFGPEPPPPPKTVNEWMSLEQMHP
jgi:hypothetical protein